MNTRSITRRAFNKSIASLAAAAALPNVHASMRRRDITDFMQCVAAHETERLATVYKSPELVGGGFILPRGMAGEVLAAAGQYSKVRRGAKVAPHGVNVVSLGKFKWCEGFIAGLPPTAERWGQAIAWAEDMLVKHGNIPDGITWFEIEESGIIKVEIADHEPAAPVWKFTHYCSICAIVKGPPPGGMQRILL